MSEGAMNRRMFTGICLHLQVQGAPPAVLGENRRAGRPRVVGAAHVGKAPLMPTQRQAHGITSPLWVAANLWPRSLEPRCFPGPERMRNRDVACRKAR